MTQMVVPAGTTRRMKTLIQMAERTATPSRKQEAWPTFTEERVTLPTSAQALVPTGPVVGLPSGSEYQKRRTILAGVAAAGNGPLQSLPALLGLGLSTRLVVTKSMKLTASIPWMAKAVEQQVRAAYMLYKGPWWDHVLLRDVAAPSVPQLGLARLLLRSIDGAQHDAVLVQRLVLETHRPGCV